MRILVDTHLLLWWMEDSPSLPALARTLIGDVSNRVHFSSASIWEVAIKASLRRRNFSIDPKALVESLPKAGFVELAITAQHAARVSQLPRHHRDPFDRILVAQSIVESMVLITNDEILRTYGSTVRLL